MSVEYLGVRLVSPQSITVKFLSGHGGPGDWVDYCDDWLPANQLQPRVLTSLLAVLCLPRLASDYLAATMPFRGAWDGVRNRVQSCCGSDTPSMNDRCKWPHVLIPMEVSVTCRVWRTWHYASVPFTVWRMDHPAQPQIDDCAQEVELLGGRPGEVAWKASVDTRRRQVDLLREPITEATSALLAAARVRTEVADAGTRALLDILPGIPA